MRILYYLSCFSLCLLLANCHTESDKQDSIKIDSSSYATPVFKNSPAKKSISITSPTFTTQGFSVKVPEGFTAHSSIVSNSLEDDFDSYFFTSPENDVKFYLYAPPTFGNPNDIIFPNEKILTNFSQQGDTTVRTWHLKKTQQTPYLVDFEEIKTSNNITITGYYYIDSKSHDQYLSDYLAFKKSVKRQNN